MQRAHVVKERPILFSGEMVRAILEGRKTQTRRLVTHSGELVPTGTKVVTDTYPSGARGWFALWPHEHGARRALTCPYGQPGDELWVRERTMVLSIAQDGRSVRVRYEADGAEASVSYPTRLAPPVVGKLLSRGCHREASRLRLRVTAVRLELLESISEADARAEGVLSGADAFAALSHVRGSDAARHLPSRLRSARDEFASLWDRINGDRAPWSSNPLVWALSWA